MNEAFAGASIENEAKKISDMLLKRDAELDELKKQRKRIEPHIKEREVKCMLGILRAIGIVLFALSSISDLVFS